MIMSEHSCVIRQCPFCSLPTDLDDMDALLKEYDDNLVHKVSTDNMFGLLDASSLLWRLEVHNSN